MDQMNYINEYRILIVEDEADIIELVEDDLIDCGLDKKNIVSTQFLTTAIEILSRESFNAILLDNHLPDGTVLGSEKLQRIMRACMGTTRIIVVSGSNYIEDIEKKLLKDGLVSAVYHKPFDIDEVVTALISSAPPPRPLENHSGISILN